MPYDIAFTLPLDERIAHIVVLGTLDGFEFDWNALRWKQAD